MVATDDFTLVARFQGGDGHALDLLVEKHRVKAYQYALRLARDADQAADLVGEAFLRVCRSLGRFKSNCAFSSWLYRIITNCYLDTLKRPLNKLMISIDDASKPDEAPIFQLVSNEAPAHETVEASELRNKLHLAISKLPDCQRVVMVLYHMESLSYDEICETLSLPLGTVKSRLNRARLTLKELLTPEIESLIAV
jgi:RNA polymerase sigma-70 factor (ECF subfamily)